MSTVITCTIPRPTTSYNIEVASGLLDNHQALADFLQTLAARFVIISDNTVMPLHGVPSLTGLIKCGLDITAIHFATGEQHKTRQTKQSIEDQMLNSKLGRDTCIIAVGGGVVTDVAGYVAATYCRGIPLVSIPTSLLAMVDASIGGKTGVDVPEGKNLIGTTYQPTKVLIDPNTLRTLPEKEFRNGIVEMIKHGLIADSDYFVYLEQNIDALLALGSATLERAIVDSCRIKKNIVEQDENETGLRRLLNLGHTVGHALEQLTHYSMSHGEAVAIGLLVEAQIAVQLGHLNKESFTRIHRLLQKLNLPLNIPTGLSAQAIIDAMSLDKKSQRGQPRFVVLQEIGNAMPFNGHYCTPVQTDTLRSALHERTEVSYSQGR